MLEYDKDDIAPEIIEKLNRYMEDPEFTPDVVRRCSIAGAAFCSWVHAMYIYHRIAQRVSPKRDMLRAAEESLENAMLELSCWQAHFKTLQDTLHAQVASGDGDVDAS